MMKINALMPKENDKLFQLIDGHTGNISYISKKTFEKAVDDGVLTYNIAGKTTLKAAKENDEKVLCSGNEQYVLSASKATTIVGYIPTSDGTFVEYRKFNAAILLLPLVVVGVGVFAIPHNTTDPAPSAPTQPTKPNVGYDVGQTTDTPNTPTAPVAESIQFPSIAMPGYDKLVMKADTTKINTISLFNPKENADWYDLAFTIQADINGDGEYETLYESAKVAPGYRINEFEIAQPLKAGSYDAKILIQPYYVEDDGATLNNGVISINLTVQ